MYTLVDFRATKIFINQSFVEKYNIDTQKLSQSVLVYNVNNIPNKASWISEIVDIILYYKTLGIKLAHYF